MNKNRKRRDSKARMAAVETAARLNRRRRRRVLKTVTGAVIGGIIAGPVGVAAGAIAGASVRRGPVRRKIQTSMKRKPTTKASAPRPGRKARPRFTNIYPNIP